MKRSWALFATLTLGCAGQATPPPHDINLVERCGEVVNLAGNLFPTDRYSFVAEHCVAPMLREPACRDAVMRSLHVDASSRNTLVARACTRAYCPRLPAPKPELCTRDFEAMSPSEMRPLGLELFAEVRKVELGDTEAERWQRVVGADAPRPTIATAPPPAQPPKVVEPKPAKKAVEPKPPKIVEPPHRVVAPEPPPKVVAPPPPPKVVAAPPKAVEPAPKLIAPTPPAKAVEPPPKVASPTPPPKAVEPPPKVVSPAQPKAVAPSADVPPGAVVVRVTVHNRALKLEVGGASWNLSEKPAPSEFDPAAERAVELGARSERVVVQLGSGIQYNDLVGILNALGRQYVSNISLSSIKE